MDDRISPPHFLWSDILKNPFQSPSEAHVDLQFPFPLPMTGCVGLVFGGGPPADGEVTISVDLRLSYTRRFPNTVVDGSGEYCFCQNWRCQNATLDDEDGFAVPILLPAGNLVELFGNLSDSTFDGTRNFGPLPTSTIESFRTRCGSLNCIVGGPLTP